MSTLGALTALALLAAPSPDLATARKALETQCRTEGADPKSPWALAHGITAFGPGFKARDGRLAREVMIQDFAKVDPARPGHYAFPEYENGEPVSPHPNLLVKTLVDAGLPLSTRFKLGKGSVTLGELVKSVESDFRVPASAEMGPWAWTFDLLAQVNQPGSSFTNAAGEKLEWNAVEEAALAHLESAQAFLGEAMDQGKPSVPKQRQFIWGEPCGGFHFVQGALTGLRYPEARKAHQARLDRQIAILFYRLGAETRVYEEALAQSPPEYVLLLQSQKLKFYGHWLETVGRLVQEGLLKPSPEQRTQITLARGMLARTVAELESRKAFARTGEFKQVANSHQLGLDLIGDACHAVHGLKLTDK